jgi:hypothetical protein
MAILQSKDLITIQYYILVRSAGRLLVNQMARNDDVRTELTEEEAFCTLQIQTKRGDGTRDEDRIKATLRRDSLDEIEADRERFLAMIENTISEVREYQPTHDGDDE